MHHEQHAEHSLRIFGRLADEVHIFLNQYWTKYRICHRRLWHHRLGVRLAVEEFGETAWGLAELHIVDDLGCILSSWIDQDPHVVYLEPQDEVEQEKDLILLYGRETYDRIRSGGPRIDGWHDGAGTYTHHNPWPNRGLCAKSTSPTFRSTGYQTDWQLGIVRACS